MVKRILSAFTAMVVLVMVMTPATVMAAPTGELIITNVRTDTTSLSGQTFKAYKVFDVDTVDPFTSEEDWIYELTSEFAGMSAAMGYDIGAEFSNIGGVKSRWEIAADTRNFIIDNAIAETGNVTAEEGEEVVYIEGLDEGYYLVTGYVSADGQNVETNSTFVFVEPGAYKDVYINTDAPRFEKEVWDVGDEFDDEDLADWDNGGWCDFTDISIGDTARFKLQTNLPNLSNLPSDFDYTFIMHDSMSDGLTLDTDSIKVYVGGYIDRYMEEVDGGALLEEGVDYEVNLNPETHGGECYLEIDFLAIRDLSISEYQEQDGEQFSWKESIPIYVIYEAQLNGEAVSYDPGNPNAASLEYSNSPYTTETNTTIEDKAVVYTFGIDLVKYTGNASGDSLVFKQGEGIYEGETTVAGAEFSLFTESDGNTSRTALRFVCTDIGSDVTSAVYRLALPEESGTTRLVTPESGRINILGLDEATYYLKEVKAPSGYKILEYDLMISPYFDFDWPDGYTGAPTDVINTMGSYWGVRYQGESQNGAGWNDDPESDTYVRLKSIGDMRLPETGGSGTKAFICGGLALMLVAGVILIIRKKSTK